MQGAPFLYRLPSFFKFLQQVFKSVQSNLIHRTEQFTELPFRKALLMEPDQVGFRQVAVKLSFVLAEWHCLANQFVQDFRIHIF